MIPPGRRERSKNVFRPPPLGADARVARPDGAGGGARAARTCRRHRPLRLPRPAPRPGVPGGAVARAACPDPRRDRRHPVARRPRPRARDGGASHRRTGAGGAACAAARAHRRPRSGLVRRRAHRRRDAGDGRRRGAIAELFRPVHPAAHDLGLRPVCHLRLRGDLGSAGRHGAARRRAAGVGRADGGAHGRAARQPCPLRRVQVVRRGIPRRRAGPADLEGVRPERCLRTPARGARAGAVGPDLLGARNQCRDARHRRSRHRPRRRTRPAARRLARHARRNEFFRCADRADGGDGNFPPLARSAQHPAPGPARTIRGGRHSFAARRHALAAVGRHTGPGRTLANHRV